MTAIVNVQLRGLVVFAHDGLNGKGWTWMVTVAKILASRADLDGGTGFGYCILANGQL